MDRLKATRRPLRAKLTKSVNEAELEFLKEKPEEDTLQFLLDKLEDTLDKVHILDEKIWDALLDSEASEVQQDEETTSIEEYDDRVRLMKIKINKALFVQDKAPSPTASEYGTTVSQMDKKRNYKLPKVQIKKFNGEPLEWLSFWSQFEKIHLDQTLDTSDKFQYLVQSMVQGTRARDVISRYPQTSENYPKAVEALKERFGKPKLLKQLYVRELHKLVLNNNMSKDNGKIAPMYDKLESHLQALESLGVTKEQTAVFLFPLIESSLPVDILIAWQRSPMHGSDGSHENPPKSELDFLMEFLRREVENEYQRILVQSTFSSNEKSKVPISENKAQKSKKSRSDISKQEEEDTPTVAGLFIGEKAKCIFCHKPHESKECFIAQRMSLEEKKTTISEKDCCFICLRAGHKTDKCKSFVKCLLCGKKHTILMCPDLPAYQKPPTTNSEPVPTVLENVACSSQVILGTVLIKIKEGNRQRQVRIFFDPGSQRNYITKSLAAELKLQSASEEKLIHCLFGGIQTGIQYHKKYIIKLKNVIGYGFSELQVLDKEKICGTIPRMLSGPWMNELKKQNIWVSDIGPGSPEVNILIGAHMFGQLMTGRKHSLQNGLTAVETKLGWILMGECNQLDGESETIAMTVTDMHILDSSVDQLWSLESIGIRDPSESQTKLEKEDLARKHFLQTVTRLDDGRYSVSLPWIDGIQKIPSNKDIAEKRLMSTTNKLQSLGLLTNYGDLFNLWLDEGIIEEVPKEEIYNPSHYLPHRAVIKPQSLTTPIRPVYDASCKRGRNPSLNNCLEKGPNLMELIPSILMRFREKKIGIVSDIRKAFQMVEISKADRDFLRFLWWEDLSQKTLKIYRHKRVVFGVTCSPFLLAAVIELHLKSVGESQKKIAEQLLTSLYVDNCVTSVDTIEDYEEF